MTKLQSKLLQMLQWYHEFCVSNNLRYYAIGGTVLGAVRHGGFIPWDDDVDVGMPRSDYERFKKLASCQINGKTGYYAEFPSENKDFVYTYGKLYDTTTMLTEKTRYKTTRGIFIDIFPLDGMGDTVEESSAFFKRIDRLNMVHSALVCSCRKGRKWYKNAAIVLTRCVPCSVLDPVKLAGRIEELCVQRDFDSSVYVANVSGGYHIKDVMPKNVFGDPKLTGFETAEIFIPERDEDYLRRLYGEWRVLPSPEKRISQHDYVFLDLTRGYREDLPVIGERENVRKA